MDIFKKLLPRTLFWRSLLIMVTPILLVQIIATVIYYDRHVEVITRRLTLGVAGDINLVLQHLDTIETKGSTTDTKRTEDFLFHIQKNMGLIVERTDLPSLDAIKVTNALSLTRQIALKTFDEALIGPAILDTSSNPDWTSLYVQHKGKIFKFQFWHKRISTSTTYLFVLWSWGLSFILVAISIIFLRNQIRPIRSLADAAEAFGRGRELPEPFKPSGAREVRQAGIAFLDMKDRIARHIRQRTDMLTGVSHDLRTPLTRMKLLLAMTNDDTIVQPLNEDIDEMEAMINGYLDFARGQGTESVSDTDLSVLVQETTQAFRRTGFNVVYDNTGQSIVVKIRPNAVKRAISNILENARRYAQSAYVRVERSGTTCVVSIDDDGPGIPESQRTEVFKPFKRLEDSRNPETGGAGLGLTIVRDIIQGMGGEIHLMDSRHGGLCVNLTFPL